MFVHLQYNGPMQLETAIVTPTPPANANPIVERMTGTVDEKATAAVVDTASTAMPPATMLSDLLP